MDKIKYILKDKTFKKKFILLSGSILSILFIIASLPIINSLKSQEKTQALDYNYAVYNAETDYSNVISGSYTPREYYSYSGRCGAIPYNCTAHESGGESYNACATSGGAQHCWDMACSGGRETTGSTTTCGGNWSASTFNSCCNRYTPIECNVSCSARDTRQYGKKQGSLIENIVADEAAYPANGLGSDGRWYVRGSKAINPTSIPLSFAVIQEGLSQKVNLSWQIPTDNGNENPSGYVIEYKRDNVSNWQIASNNLNSLVSSIDGLTLGATYDFRVAAINSAGRSPWATATFKLIDTVNPTATITRSTEAPTQELLLTLNPDEAIETPAGWTKTNPSQEISTYTMTVTTNGTQTVDFVDLSGNKGKASTKITNIDRIKPTIDSITYSPNIKTNQDVTVTITVNESIQLPSGWTRVASTQNQIQRVFTSNHNLAQSLTISDIAGNLLTTKYQVTNIDKVQPTISSIILDDTRPTNQPVRLTLRTNEEIVTPAGWTKNNDTEYTKLFTENTNLNFNIVDLAGNITNVQYNITNVDMIKPVFNAPNYLSEIGKSLNILDPSRITVTDNRDGNVPVSITNVTDFDGINLNNPQKGSYKIKYRVSDKVGNTATHEQIIKIVEMIAPDIAGSIQDIIVTEEDTKTFNPLSGVTAWSVSNQSDITSLLKHTIAPTLNKENPVLGKYTIEYMITDSNNNLSSSITRNLTIVSSEVAREAITALEMTVEASDNLNRMELLYTTAQIEINNLPIGNTKSQLKKRLEKARKKIDQMKDIDVKTTSLVKSEAPSPKVYAEIKQKLALVTNSSFKNKINNLLNSIKDKIDKMTIIIELVDYAEEQVKTSPNLPVIVSAYEIAKKAVDEMPEEGLRDELEKRLKKIKNFIDSVKDIENNIEALGHNSTEIEFKKIENKIKILDDSKVKKELQEKLYLIKSDLTNLLPPNTGHKIIKKILPTVLSLILIAVIIVLSIIEVKEIKKRR